MLIECRLKEVVWLCSIGRSESVIVLDSGAFDLLLFGKAEIELVVAIGLTSALSPVPGVLH